MDYAEYLANYDRNQPEAHTNDPIVTAALDPSQYTLVPPEEGNNPGPTNNSTGLGLLLSRALAKAGGGWLGLADSVELGRTGTITHSISSLLAVGSSSTSVETEGPQPHGLRKHKSTHSDPALLTRKRSAAYGDEHRDSGQLPREINMTWYVLVVTTAAQSVCASFVANKVKWCDGLHGGRDLCEAIE